VDKLADTPPAAAPVEAERLALTPAAAPAETEKEALTETTAAAVAVMDPEMVPEQSLRRRALVLSLKTRVGPPAEVGENAPAGTASTSVGTLAVF